MNNFRDTWNDSFNQIIQSNSLDWLKQAPDCSVPIFLTSPPYNLRNTKSGGVGSNWKDSKIVSEGYEGYDDNIPMDQYIEWQQSLIKEMIRVSIDDGLIFYNHHWRSQAGVLERLPERIIKPFEDQGLLRTVIIWRKRGHNFNKNLLRPEFELIYVLSKSKLSLAKGANSLTNVWDIPQERLGLHPASFPVELVVRCLKMTDHRLVVDPFMGSGTTAIAARRLGRYYIGIEQSAEYIKMAEERIKSDYLSKRFFKWVLNLHKNHRQ